MSETQIEQTLQATLAPLKEQFLQLEAEIAQDSAALEAKRKLRTRVSGVLRQLDPSWASENGAQSPGPRQRAKPGQGKTYHISEQKQETVLAYIRAHHGDGEPFYGQQLPLSELGMSDPTRNAALRRLQERGLLRLDHVGPVPGKGQSNRANWYALIRGG